MHYTTPNGGRGGVHKDQKEEGTGTLAFFQASEPGGLLKTIETRLSPDEEEENLGRESKAGASRRSPFQNATKPSKGKSNTLDWVLAAWMAGALFSPRSRASYVPTTF